MKTELIYGSARSLKGIGDVIELFYCGSVKTLVADGKRWQVCGKDGRHHERMFVVKRNGRFLFIAEGEARP